MTKTDFSKCECHHCAGHIEFPSAASGETIPCPHCSQPTTLPSPPAVKNFPAKFILLLFGTVVLVAAARIYFSNTAPTPISTAPTAIAHARLPEEFITNNFAIGPFTLQKTPGSSLVYITGTARNLAAQPRFGVKIIFALLDTNQAALGNASDYRPMLEAGGQWNFKALVLESKAAAARLNSIRDEK